MSETHKKQQPPRHIGKTGATWWKSVIANHTPSPTDYALMILAAECLDTAASARDEIKKQGMVVPTKHSFKTNPLVAVEGNNKLVFLRLIRQLGIQGETP